MRCLNVFVTRSFELITTGTPGPRSTSPAVTGKLNNVEQLPQLFRALHSKSPDFGLARSRSLQTLETCGPAPDYVGSLKDNVLSFHFIDFAVLVTLYYQQ